MPMPTLNAVGTVTAVATGACVPGLPAGWAADDFHLLFVEAANEPLNAISGFTRIGSTAVVQSTGLVTDLSAFWRRAIAGDTAPSQDDGHGRVGPWRRKRGHAASRDAVEGTRQETDNRG